MKAGPLLIQKNPERGPPIMILIDRQKAVNSFRVAESRRLSPPKMSPVLMAAVSLRFEAPDLFLKKLG